jgi:hypothetical protein
MAQYEIFRSSPSFAMYMYFTFYVYVPSIHVLRILKCRMEIIVRRIDAWIISLKHKNQLENILKYFAFNKPYVISQFSQKNQDTQFLSLTFCGFLYILIAIIIESRAFA